MRLTKYRLFSDTDVIDVYCERRGNQQPSGTVRDAAEYDVVLETKQSIVIGSDVHIQCSVVKRATALNLRSPSAVVGVGRCCSVSVQINRTGRQKIVWLKVAPVPLSKKA